MGLSLADLYVRIGADLSEFHKKMELASKEVEQIANKLQSIGRKMTFGITTPLLGVGAAAVKMAGDLEQSRIAFTTMLGSAEAADDFLRDLFAFAKQTPFEFTGLEESARKLLAFGFNAKAIIPMMDAIGNAVAGLGGGAEMINRVTLALGQMHAKGKVSAQEMMQLAESGIPAWEILARAIGVTIPEAMKRAENGAIDSTTAISALIEGMNERFPDMMKKQSQSINGMFSTLKDTVGEAMREIGEDIAQTFDIKGKIKGVTEFLEKLTLWFKNLSPEMKQIVLYSAAIVAALGPMIATLGVLLALLPSIVTGLGMLHLGFVLPQLAIAALAGLIMYLIVRYLDPLGKVIAGLGRVLLSPIPAIFSLGEAFAGLGDLIMGALTFDPDRVRTGLESLKKGVASSILAMGNEIEEGWNDIISGVSEGADAMKKDVSAAIDKASDLWEQGQKLFTMPTASGPKMFDSQKMLEQFKAAMLEMKDKANKEEVTTVPIHLDLNLGQAEIKQTFEPALKGAEALTFELNKIRDIKIADGLKKETKRMEVSFKGLEVVGVHTWMEILEANQKSSKDTRQTVVTTNELMRVSAQGVANAIKSIWMGTTTTFKQAWQAALNSFIDILAEMVVQAHAAGTSISISMAAASAGITLIAGMIASVFGGKGSGGGKSKIQQATEDFLSQIKRTLEAFENDVLNTLENIARVTGKGRAALADLAKNLNELSQVALGGGDSSRLRHSSDEQRRMEHIREKIIENAKVLENAIMDEFRLKRDLINQTMDLLKREIGFAKDINQSITDVTRSTFSPEQLFKAQLGDIESLKRLAGQATGEEKIALLADLKEAFMSAWGTAQDLFGENPAELKRWQDYVISGLEQIKVSGMSEFDRLIQINLDALDLGQRQLDTQKQLETHLSKIEEATRRSLEILAEIVGGPLNTGQVRELETQLNVLGFANGGVATGPTLGVFGEAGPEAIVPLDRLDSMMSSGRGQTIIIQLDGKTIAQKTVQHMPKVLRMQGVPA